MKLDVDYISVCTQDDRYSSGNFLSKMKIHLRSLSPLHSKDERILLFRDFRAKSDEGGVTPLYSLTAKVGIFSPVEITL